MPKMTFAEALEAVVGAAAPITKQRVAAAFGVNPGSLSRWIGSHQGRGDTAPGDWPAVLAGVARTGAAEYQSAAGRLERLAVELDDQQGEVRTRDQ